MELGFGETFFFCQTSSWKCIKVNKNAFSPPCLRKQSCHNHVCFINNVTNCTAETQRAKWNMQKYNRFFFLPCITLSEKSGAILMTGRKKPAITMSESYLMEKTFLQVTLSLYLVIPFQHVWIKYTLMNKTDITNNELAVFLNNN